MSNTRNLNNRESRVRVRVIILLTKMHPQPPCGYILKDDEPISEPAAKESTRRRWAEPRRRVQVRSARGLSRMTQGSGVAWYSYAGGQLGHAIRTGIRRC